MMLTGRASARNSAGSRYRRVKFHLELLLYLGGFSLSTAKVGNIWVGFQKSYRLSHVSKKRL
jgi:hypothetical protein